MPEPTADRRAAVVGLGFVGIPVAARLAEVGLQVVGLDRDETRASAVAQGEYPIVGQEPGIADLVRSVVARGRLTATTDPAKALKGADVVVVCVQTPVDETTHRPKYEALRAACRTIGEHLRKGMLVVVESTLAPTTMETLVQPTLEKASGLKAGPDFDLAHCPERVTPGKLLKNLATMPRVVGGLTPAAAARARALYATIVEATLETADARVAETVKTAENAYRDVQIAFANELALLCDRLGVDVHEVRRLVNQVPERNVHAPGVGVGGHCIPKDPWLLIHGADALRVAQVIPAARRLNEAMPGRFADRVVAALRAVRVKPKGATVLVLGAAYRENTEDLRHSPSQPLAERLAEAGCKVLLHDPHARGKLGGFALRSEPVEALAEGADAVVLATGHDAYRRLDLRKLARAMRTRILADGRNMIPRADAEAAGFTYLGVGKGRR